MIAHLVGDGVRRFVGDVLCFVRNIASHGRGLVSADGVFLISIDLVGLLASDFVQLIAADGGREIAAYGIRHIAARIVDDILGIVCDSTIFCSIGDILCILLRFRNGSTISDL